MKAQVVAVYKLTQHRYAQCWMAAGVSLRKFISDNYHYVATYFENIKYSGHVSSVHAAIGWRYRGRLETHRGETVLAVAKDRGKGKWDFPGGKNESTKTDPVVQFLETLYKELKEELGIVIKVPLGEIVLDIIRGGNNRRCFLIVCGIKGLSADRFRAVMKMKAALNRQHPGRLSSSYLEMNDFRYLCLEDIGLLTHSTEYVQSRCVEVIETIQDEIKKGTRFPSFDEVMMFSPLP